MSEQDKYWLAADLKRVLFGEPRRVTKYAAAKSGERTTHTNGFSILIPDSRQEVLAMSAVPPFMGLFFLGVAWYIFGDSPFFGQRASDLFIKHLERMMGGASIVFLTAILLVALTMIVGGTYWFFRNWNHRHNERKLEGDATQMFVRETRNGLVLSEQAFARDSVKSIRAKSSGESNGRLMKRIDLRVDGKEQRLALWVKGEEADDFVEEAKRLLF